VLRVSNCLIVNAYFPCVGTTNRQIICDDLLADIGAWCDQYCATCDIIFAGDFNVNLDSTDHVSTAINSFLARYSLVRGDVLFPAAKVPTYVNEALKQSSMIDYIVTSVPRSLLDFTVSEPDSNFSEPLQTMGTFRYNAATQCLSGQMPDITPSAYINLQIRQRRYLISIQVLYCSRSYDV